MKMLMIYCTESTIHLLIHGSLCAGLEGSKAASKWRTILQNIWSAILSIIWMMKSTMTEKQMGDYHLFHLCLTERKGHLTFRTANTLFPQFLKSAWDFHVQLSIVLPKVCLSILSTAFSPWKCNPENECRETKLRDPIWSGTTSLISCTSDLWEHSGSATLWQYRGIKQMKENSLAREEIRWAEGEEKTI